MMNIKKKKKRKRSRGTRGQRKVVILKGKIFNHVKASSEVVRYHPPNHFLKYPKRGEE